MSEKQLVILLEHHFDKGISKLNFEYRDGNLFLQFVDAGGNQFKRIVAANGRMIELEV